MKAAERCEFKAAVVDLVWRMDRRRWQKQYTLRVLKRSDLSGCAHVSHLPRGHFYHLALIELAKPTKRDVSNPSVKSRLETLSEMIHSLL